MTVTISRLYNSQVQARAAVRDLEAAGLAHGDISILVSNADSAYDEKTKMFPDRDLDGKDDRAEGAAAGGGIGAAAGGTVGRVQGEAHGRGHVGASGTRQALNHSFSTSRPRGCAQCHPPAGNSSEASP